MFVRLQFFGSSRTHVHGATRALVKSSRKKLRSVVGYGETVGRISVDVGDGTSVAVADGLNTMVSDGSGVARERKLQAGRRIRINRKKSFRILDSCKDDRTSTILKEIKRYYRFITKVFLLKLLNDLLSSILNGYNNSLFVNSLI